MAYPTVFTHSGPAAVDKILATTLSDYRSEMSDNIFTAMPFFHWLYKNGKKSEQSGLSIIMPLSYAKNNTVAAYSRFDTIDTTPQETITSNQFKWMQYAAAVSLSGFDLRVNKGPKQLINLIKKEIENCEQSCIDKIGVDLFAATKGTNNITPLTLMVDATSTIGEINSTTHSWWQATNTGSGVFAAQGIKDMRVLYNTLSKNTKGQSPDLIITTQSIFESYENALLPQLRYSSTDTADGSFETLKFKGAVMFFDENCNSGVLYELNSKHLELVVHPDADFALSDYVRPSNQDAKTAIMIWQGELVSDARRYNGKLNSIT